MKAFWKDFVHRGLLAAGFGPLVLAIIYGILGATGEIASLSPGQVTLGIVSVTMLAFVVAGMNAIYQLERLPLSVAIAIHGAVLYAAYILIYLINGWLKSQKTAIGIFTLVFLAGYGVIWCIIFAINRHKAKKINLQLGKQ